MLWFSIAVAVLVGLGCAFIACYIISMFTSAEDDEDHGWLCRVLAVCFITLACCNVLLLPFDVAVTSETDAHECNAPQPLLILRLSQLSVSLSAVLLVAGVPCAVVLYEHDEPGLMVSTAQRAKLCAVAAASSTVMSCSAFFALWLSFGYEVNQPLTGKNLSCITPASAHAARADAEQGSSAGTETIRVPPLLYLTALMSSAGWFCFVWTGALGLAATPIVGVWHFLHRPRLLSVEQYEALRKQLHDESAKLLAEGRGLEAAMFDSRANHTHKQWQRLQAFRRRVRALQNRVDEMHAVAEFWSDRSVVQAYVLFIISLCCGVASVAWLLHILLCNTVPLFSFLDALISGLNRVFPMLAVLAYAILALYLLWCTVLGGLLLARLPFAPVPTFEMRTGATTPSVLLFGSMMLLLSSFAVEQLCTISFPAYATGTTLLDLYNYRLPSVQGIRHVAPWMQYALVTLTLLFALFVSMRPGMLSAATVSDEDDDAIAWYIA